MILLDCGNSRLKAQQRIDGAIRASFATRYDASWPARLAAWLRQVEADRAAYCSVLDHDRQLLLETVLADRFDGTIERFVSTPEALGVVNGYLDAERLGDDRWMALLAAAEIAAGDVIVIDAGSAITLDLLRADGRHLGGAILPGFETSPGRFREIFAYIDFDHPDIAAVDVPGGSTEAAIQLDYGRSSLERLPELVNRWRKAYLPDASLLLTGGDAERVQQLLDLPARQLPDLVLRGIARMARA